MVCAGAAVHDGRLVSRKPRDRLVAACPSSDLAIYETVEALDLRWTAVRYVDFGSKKEQCSGADQ
ncbi:hypothetical protein CASFOL_036844 [Castilleja foliolosa]|uniref:Uncharacterized protein n=1 Tax=Castilleja foliolosa TaxID=1961234 RepID=A0ABD3BPR6_9LAMI